MALTPQGPTAHGEALAADGRTVRKVGAEWGALVAVAMATTAVLIDFVAVSLALPRIRGSFGASFSELQSVVEAFVVCLAAFVLGAGYVADRIGQAKAFVTGLALFGSGSLVAGLAPSIYLLIGARAVQGVGAALLLATSALLLAEIYRGARARAALAIWGTSTGLAVVASPLVGGLITSYLGWRWIFVLEAVVAGGALVTTKVTVPEPAPDHTRTTSADWRGLALLTAAVAILVTGLVRTTTALGSWAQSGVLACFACSGLLLIAFVAIEAVSPAPMIDLSLFRLRTFTATAVAAFGLSMAVLGPLVFLVLYLSYGLGDSTMSIGAHLLLLTGMTLPFLPLAWWLDKHVPVKALFGSGLASVAIGLWLLSRLPSNPTLDDLTPGLVIAGLGLELLNPRLASTAAAPVRAQFAAPASRANSSFRWVGAAIGVAVLGSVFTTRLSDDISRRVAGSSQLSGQGPQLASLALEGRTNVVVGSAPVGYRSLMLGIVRESLSNAMHEVFLVAAAVALVSALVALFVRSRDVPKQELPAGAAAVLALDVGTRRVPPAQVRVARLEPAPVEPLPVEPVPVEPVPVEPVPVDVVGEILHAAVPALPLASVMALGPAPVAIERTQVPTTPSTGPTGATGTTDGSATGGTPALIDLHGLVAAPARARPDLIPAPDQSLVAIGALVAHAATASVGIVGAGCLAGQVSKSQDGLPLKAEVALVSPDAHVPDAHVPDAHVPDAHVPDAHVVARHWTGPDGKFILLDLAAGNYVLVVQSIGYRSQTVPVVVRRGDTISMDIAMVGLGHVFGAVAARSGGWLPGVLLTLTDGTGLALAHTTTDDAGSFYFSRVPEGCYTVGAPGCGTTASVIDISSGSAVAADLVLDPVQGENGEVVIPLAGGAGCAKQ